MRISFLCFLILSALAMLAAPASAQSGSVERGAYLFALAGCGGCHTDEAHKGLPLAGGPPLVTPFGTFYGPNISRDQTYGIGAWSDTDFIQALRQGLRPDGAHLFPAFPYTSFTLMTDTDLLDLKAYLFSLPPAASPSRPHDIRFPFSWRWLQTFWRLLNFSPGPFRPDITQSPAWNRGAYVVEAVAHCGECHTPRDIMGGAVADLAYAGTPAGPGGQRVANITPDKATGIGSWAHSDIVGFLRNGMLPDGDFAGSLMGEVIQRSTSKMSDTDRDAVATYLQGLTPVSNPRARATQAGFN